MVWHRSLPLMNSFNKTKAAVFSYMLCFLRAFPFISFLYSFTKQDIGPNYLFGKTSFTLCIVYTRHCTSSVILKLTNIFCFVHQFHRKQYYTLYQRDRMNTRTRSTSVPSRKAANGSKGRRDKVSGENINNNIKYVLFNIQGLIGQS